MGTPHLLQMALSPLKHFHEWWAAGNLLWGRQLHQCFQQWYLSNYIDLSLHLTHLLVENFSRTRSATDRGTYCSVMVVRAKELSETAHRAFPPLLIHCTTMTHTANLLVISWWKKLLFDPPSYLANSMCTLFWNLWMILMLLFLELLQSCDRYSHIDLSICLESNFFQLS